MEQYEEYKEIDRVNLIESIKHHTFKSEVKTVLKQQSALNWTMDIVNKGKEKT